MDTPMIGGLPSTPGTVRVGATRDQRKGRDRPFEQAFNSSGESDNTQTASEEEPSAGGLQRASPPSERPLRMVSM